MSINAADLHEAINAAWEASVLNATFRALWDADVVPAEFPVLHDQEAGPGQPFPYCVFEQSGGITTDRMSGGTDFIREIRDVPWVFRVHARAVDGDDRTAKGIAAALAEEVTKVFGGHPTVAETALTLDNGRHLLTQQQNDYGVKTGDDEYQWNVPYIFRLDVPVAV